VVGAVVALVKIVKTPHRHRSLLLPKVPQAWEMQVERIIFAITQPVEIKQDQEEVAPVLSAVM
jgi:hypothetical protein